LDENLKLMESTGRDADPLLNLAGYGHIGGKLPAAAAAQENTARANAMVIAQRMRLGICNNQMMPP
jgi:hypothetical protein